MTKTSRTFATRTLGSIALFGVALASLYACTTSSDANPTLNLDAGEFSISNCPNGGVLASACAACITTSCSSQVAAVDNACASALACACPAGVDAASCTVPSTCVSAIETAALQCTTCESACGIVDAGHDAGGDATVPVTDAGSDGAATDAFAPDATDAFAPPPDATDAFVPPPDATDAFVSTPDAFVTFDAGLPPSQVQAAHLQLWLRADDGVISSGATEPYAVSVWQDLSGNGRNATQSSAANQPLLHITTPLTGTGSSLPWIQFVPGTGDGNGGDAGSNSLFMGVDLSFLLNSPYTIIAVASRYSDKSENYFMGTHFGGAGTDMALHVGWSDDTDFYLGQFGDDLSASVTANPATGWQPVLATAKLATDAGHAIYLGGTLATSNTSTGALQAADRGILGRGYATTPDNSYFAGGLGEIIVYDTALSDADRQSVEAYLQARWQP